MAHAGDEPALRPIRRLCLRLRIPQFPDQGAAIPRQDDQCDQQTDAELLLAPPILAGEDHRQETAGGHDDRSHEIREAVAEAVAEGHPEIDRVERRRAFAAQQHERRGGAEVGDHAEHTADDGGGRSGDDHRELAAGDDKIGGGQPGCAAHRDLRAVECAAGGEEGEEQADYEDADQRLLMLAVRTIAQAVEDGVEERAARCTAHHTSAPCKPSADVRPFRRNPQDR
jgi:hypothetical protein